MSFDRRTFLLQLCALAALPVSARAQGDFPSKPIRFIVPYSAGGPADMMARLVQPGLQQVLGQPVLVENRTGAGGNLGTDFVAKAEPDGHTLLLGASGPLAVNKALYRNLAFDPERDLRGVVQIGAFPLVLVTTAETPAKTPQEFIAWLKDGPESRRTFASAGSGTPQHLAAEMFARSAGLKLVHVPYKGAGPALVDVMGGQVPFMFEITAGAIPHVRAGKLRAIALTSAQRSPGLPDVPTLAESGLEDFEFTAWNGVSVPRATPDAVVERLNAAFRQVLSEPGLRAKWAELGALLPLGPASEFDALVRRDAQRLGRLVKEHGIRPD